MKFVKSLSTPILLSVCKLLLDFEFFLDRVHGLFGSLYFFVDHFWMQSKKYFLLLCKNKFKQHIVKYILVRWNISVVQSFTTYSKFFFVSIEELSTNKSWAKFRKTRRFVWCKSIFLFLRIFMRSFLWNLLSFKFFISS